MQILAILQARMRSVRLPGKVLLPIAGEPMLWRQIERIRRSTRVSRLLVATSLDASDNAIDDFCRGRGVECFRGSQDDVLDRFYQAARPIQPDHVIRLTGDCPLTDPVVIDVVSEFFLTGSYDYATNAIEPTFPDGLDVEIFRFSVLETAWKEARLVSEREHVTPFIRNHPEKFRVGIYKQATDLSHLRWTVDEPLDYELVSFFFKDLYSRNPCFTTQDVLDLIAAKPELKIWNSRIMRNEGYERSLREDRKA